MSRNRNGSPTGLSSTEVLARRKQYGKNSLPEEKTTSVWTILINQVKSPLVYIILVAALVCDEHTPFVIWVDNLHLAFARVEARLHWSITTGRDPESWSEGIHLMDEWNYYEHDDSPLKAFRWVRLIPPLAKSSGIFHYQLG